MPRFRTVKLARPPPRRRSEPRPSQFLTAGFFLGAAGASVSSRRNADDLAQGPEAARESAVYLDRIDAPVLSERFRIQERWQCCHQTALPSSSGCHDPLVGENGGSDER